MRKPDTEWRRKGLQLLREQFGKSLPPTPQKCESKLRKRRKVPAGWIDRLDRLPNREDATRGIYVEYLLEDGKTTLVGHYQLHFSPATLIAWRPLKDESKLPKTKWVNPNASSTGILHIPYEQMYPNGHRAGD